MSNLAPLRFSVLKMMGRSPAHAKWALDHGVPDTAAMRLGRLAHATMLGRAVPTLWKGERRGKAWTEFRDAHEGEDIITEEEMDKASAIAVALHRHREASRLLMGKREETVLFGFAGRECQTTPDAYNHETLTELKTTADASPGRFQHTALRLAYHAQLAFQKDGLKLAGKADPRWLAIVAVEVKPPYGVAVYDLTDRAEDFGRRLYRTWLEEFLVCERSNTWPGYVDGVLDAPEDAVELVGPGGEVIEVD